MNDEQPKPHPVLPASDPQHHTPRDAGPLTPERRAALSTLALRFAAGGCCGKRPTLTTGDLEAAGLGQIPTVYVATIGHIIPRSGWRSMCVYVYEVVVRRPFPVPERGDEWGDVVAVGLRSMLDHA